MLNGKNSEMLKLVVARDYREGWTEAEFKSAIRDLIGRQFGLPQAVGNLPTDAPDTPARGTLEIGKAGGVYIF